MKVRFQADANLDPDIGLGLQRRDPSVDYRLALGVIPDRMVDPDVLGLASEDGRVVTNDLRMPKHFADFTAGRDSPGLLLVPPRMSIGETIEGLFLCGYRGPQRRCEARSDGCRADTGIAAVTSRGGRAALTSALPIERPGPSAASIRD